MKIYLRRFAYMDSCTRGQLNVRGNVFETIERPWVRNPKGPGGLPFKSCVQDGSYILRPFTRPSGNKAFILSNPDLGVFEQDDDRKSGEWGRYLILIHSGNTVEDVVGCIAPGMSGVEKAVWESRKAMSKIVGLLQDDEHELVIEPKGTS